MPAKRTHALIGAASGASAYLLACDRFGRPATGIEFLLSFGLGAAIGTAPDAFEPAIHSWHRGFGHSLTLGVGLVSVAANGCAEESTWSSAAKVFAAVIVAAYVSHIVADALTPRGIPLLR